MDTTPEHYFKKGMEFKATLGKLYGTLSSQDKLIHRLENSHLSESHKKIFRENIELSVNKTLSAFETLFAMHEEFPTSTSSHHIEYAIEAARETPVNYRPNLESLFAQKYAPGF